MERNTVGALFGHGVLDRASWRTSYRHVLLEVVAHGYMKQKLSTLPFHFLMTQTLSLYHLLLQCHAAMSN